MNHPASDEIYALVTTRFRSERTWTTSRRIPCLFTLSTYKHNTKNPVMEKFSGNLVSGVIFSAYFDWEMRKKKKKR